MSASYVLKLNEIDSDHLPIVGHFCARLGELAKNGIPVPPGFVINIKALEKFKKENNLDIKAKHLINTINFADPHSVRQVSEIIKKHFLDSRFPADIANEIYFNYKKLGNTLKDSRIIMTTSPVSHHEKRTHFFEDIKGESNIIEKVKECWALNYTEDRLLIGYTNASEHSSAILVSKLIDPEASGKIYTSDPFENIKNQIIITAMYGHLETRTNYVSMPDIYIVGKNTFEIVSKEISNQMKMTSEKNHMRRITEVSKKLRNKQKISDRIIIELAKLGKEVEKIYFFPQEIDWSIQNGQIFLTHIRPVTHLRNNTN